MSKATKLGQHYQCYGRVNILVLKHEDPCRPGQSADTHTQHSMLKDGTRQSTTTNGAEQLHRLGYRQCRILMHLATSRMWKRILTDTAGPPYRDRAQARAPRQCLTLRPAGPGGPGGP